MASIIGCDGFGFARDGDHWEKITQSGPAVLEDDVEVQANSCIDRASVGETRIARGVKIDNLVQVGHGSAVGEHTLLCAQVGLAGSTVVGKNVILAGQVGVAGHCNIGDGVIVTAQSGTHGDIPAGIDGQRLAGLRSQTMVACRQLSSINFQNLQKRCEALWPTAEQLLTPRKKNRSSRANTIHGTIARQSPKLSYLSSRSCF